MTAGTGAIKQGRKFDQVVEGAREIFLSAGFEGASVDDIARAAQVSKATLYSYFPDKRLLFMEMATAQCQAQADEVLVALDKSKPPRVVLPYIGRSVLDFLLSDMGQRVFRICAAEADRFPELGAQFYECGPVLVRSELQCYLAAAMAWGDVEIDDLGREYAKLRDDFNRAVESLSSVMHTIISSSRAVDDGASDIREATNNLSSRTEHAAKETAGRAEGWKRSSARGAGTLGDYSFAPPVGVT
mgnify:CR=1 FL=1